MALSDINVRLTADIKDFTSKMRKAQRSFKKISGSLKSIGSSMTKNISGPIAALGVGSVMAAAKFEKSMNQVKAVTELTGAEFEALNKQAKDLGASTQFSASQAAEAMGFLGMAGFDATQILAAMPATLDLAAAGGLDLAAAADIASNILSGFGAEASQMGHFADVMAKGFTSSNTSLEGLGNAMAAVAPVASGFGISVEETTAAIGKLSDAGIQGESAGTGLRAILATLSSKAKELGINVFDAAGNMLPLQDQLKQIEEKGLSTGKIMDIFGKKAGPAMLALLKVGSKGLGDFTTELENAGGTAQEVAATKLQGLSGDLTKLKSTVEGLAIQFGEILMPTIVKVVGKIKEMADWFGALDQEAKENILKWGLIVAAIGPVILIMGSLVSGVGSIIGVMTTLGPLLMTAGAVLLPMLSTAFTALFAIIMANPLIAVATAITGLGVAIYKFVTAEDEAVESTAELNKETEDLTKTTEDQTTATDKAAIANENLAKKINKVAVAVRKVNTAVSLKAKQVTSVGSGSNTGTPKLGPRPGAPDLGDAFVGGVSGMEKMSAGLDAISSKVLKFSETYGEAMNMVFDVFSMGIENQNLKLDESHAAELKRINDSKISEEKKAKAIEKLEAKTAEKRTKLKRKQAIADKAAAIAQAIINTAVQVAAVVAYPPLAILTAALGAAQVGLIASQPIPFAEGGLVTGPTMGLVGEGRGTTRSNPEVIAPLDKLKGMIDGGSQRVVVSGRISGDDLLLVQEKAQRRQNRIR